VITALTVVAAIGASLWFGLRNADNPSRGTVPPGEQSQYPVGTADGAEPSGEAPPGADALAGYKLTYVNDFLGTSLPAGWYVFTGVPGGDPNGQFAASHVVVSDGLLNLNTWKDPEYQDRWVTGGLCQCGVSRTYGAYFVRSRVTGAGPNVVQLLWPTSNVWPPEIDFSETGGSIASAFSTVHYGLVNNIEQRSVSIDMGEWHTWGVVWTSSSISYVVDGQVWGTIPTTWEIPNIPMTLDFEQRTMCSMSRQCPTQPVSMQIDWVAEYADK